MGKLSKLILILFWCSLLVALNGECQQFATFRIKKISTKGLIKLDSLSILPGTINMNGVDSSYYIIDPLQSSINWIKKVANDSITISYRVIPFNLKKTVYKYNYDSIKNRFLAGNKMIINKGPANLEEYLGGKKINYSGSFGRNMSFGNNQDASFNSEFNLQINGLIGDSIEMMAAITDNNIPVQPDGNSKQLNEFDRILIQFKKNNWELNLGDIDIKAKQSYFLNFYKRTQGILFKNQNISAIGAKHNITLGAGIAKGKFTRNIFQGLEGNQGPYRLQGANNELYFVVLSNSEKVFLDGEQMQRGIDQDYIINYNTAEITFTSKHLITKDKRIQVEFEYADKNYLNYLAFGEDNMEIGKKLKLSIAAYNNNDVPGSPINQTIDNKQKQFLANLGDSISNAYYPNATKDSFSVNNIMYKMIDTLYNGIHASIYVYSTSPDSAFYNLSFAFTGANKGNYIPYYNAANGKAYQWIAPVNGIAQGTYEPAIFLVTPKSQQIINVRSEYTIDSKTSIKTELAGSHYNINMLSQKDKQNDYGYAGKLIILHNNKFVRNKHTYLYQWNAGYEMVDENFKPLEVLRTVEFARDWGLSILNNPAQEHLPSAGIKIADEKNNSAEYAFKGYLRSDGYKGTMHQFRIIKGINDWQIQSFVQYTANATPATNGYYIKPSIDIQRTIKQWYGIIVSGSYAAEYNKQQYTQYDSLSLSSFAFTSYSAQIRNSAIKMNHWAISYTQRTNKIPVGNALLDNDISSNYGFTMELLKNKKHQLRTNITYRQLRQEYGIAKGTEETTVLSRSEYSFNEWKGSIKGNIVYEIGNGQEQKKDLSYFEVLPGKGQYVWIDYNNDGIQQLNEFEIAQFADQAKYIRIYTPTNEYTKTNYTILGYNIQILPSVLKSASKGWMKMMRLISMQSSLQTQTKTLYSGNLRFNPFKDNLNDTNLIQNNYTWNNTLSFNRFGNWGIDAGRNVNFNKSLLTYGLESTEFTEYSIRGRYSFKQQFLLELIQKFSDRSLTTPSFNNRNYALTGNSTEPKLTFSPNNRWRLVGSYQYASISNAIAYGGESSVKNSFTFESKLNFVQNAGINLRFSGNNITYSGTSFSTVSYVMLDGLQPGKNYLWNIELTKRLMNSLEISINYEGRKTGESKTINIGRASVRAIL